MAETKSEESAAEETPRKRARKDNRPQEIVAAAFEEFAAKGYAGDQGRGCGHASARLEGPALSLLQDQGRTVQGGDQKRHYLAFRRDPRADGEDRPPCRGVSQGPVPLLHPGAGRLQARLHRAAPHRRRAQASRTHQILLRASGLARHRDHYPADRSRHRARRVQADASCATIRSCCSRRCSRQSSGVGCSSATVASTPTDCSGPTSNS